MDINTQQIPAYSSLEELQRGKEQILDKIRKDSAEIGTKWHSMFYSNTMSNKKGVNMSTLINTGAGLFDGFMLAWKLYKKFKK